MDAAGRSVGEWRRFVRKLGVTPVLYVVFNVHPYEMVSEHKIN